MATTRTPSSGAQLRTSPSPAMPHASKPTTIVPLRVTTLAPEQAIRAPNLLLSGKPHFSQGSSASAARHDPSGDAANLGGGGVIGVGGFYSSGHWHHGSTSDAVVSLILFVMLGFVFFMAVFFWKKYKHIHLSVPSYEYSQLSQGECDSDLTEVADDLGISLGTSSTDEENCKSEGTPFQDPLAAYFRSDARLHNSTVHEELEPATIVVTASYISPKPPSVHANNNNIICNIDNNDIVSTALDSSPTVPLPLALTPVPLLPEAPPPPPPLLASQSPRHSLLSDSDEELLQ